MPRAWTHFVIVSVLSCFLPSSIGEAQSKPVRRVLIFNEVGTAYPGINLMDEGIRSALHTSSYKLEVYREYMDTLLFPDPADQQRFRDFYIRKYQDRKPDVIITVGPSPLKFMLETHHSAFPGVPIAFCLPTWGPGTPVLDSDFSGVENAFAPFETIKAALRLQPSTKHIVVVGGTGAHDKLLEELVRDRLRPYERNFDLSYLTNLTMPDLVERLKRLPNDTIVLFTGMGQDAAGTKFISGEEAIEKVVAAAKAPVFGMNDVNLGHGEVGGKVTYIREQGRIAGDMALRMLHGERPQDLPRVRDITAYMFDFRALKRWGFKESDLPPGSIVLNRQPDFWELYWRYVIAGLLALFTQAAAILGLLWQRAKKRKIEADLRSSEAKFAQSFRDSPLAMSILTVKEDRYLEVNETFEQLTGWKSGEAAGRSLSDINLWVDPDQRRPFLEKLLSKGTVRDVEIKIRTKGGQILTTLTSAELIDAEGEPFVLLVFADITQRKQAEEALANVSRKLIGAQEQERTRIARELHDDINQRIAMLSVEFDRLEQGEQTSGQEHHRRAKELQQRLLELGIEVQAISHRLHSSKLEYLGLVVASKSFCREVAERHMVTIDFAAHDVPHELPQEVSLCVFRILQESVNNAIKYSGVERFEVQLRGQSGEIELKVRDNGVGFDAESAMNGVGLGLISMRERASLVNGTLSIRSKPMSGTEVSLHVPLVSVKSAVEMASGAA